MVASDVTPHMALMIIVSELIFVIILVYLSGMGPFAETLITTLLIGFWVVYLTNTKGSIVDALKFRR